jgi:phage/plasmid-associated DNA primase
MEKEVIANELPGILNLILKAPDTMLEHPKCGVLAEEFAEMSSPYLAFANDCCQIGDDQDFIPVDILWAYYTEWCNNYNHRSPSAQKFKIEFPSAVSGLKRYRPRLNKLEIQEIKTDHNLKRRLTTRLTISERPQCYRNIRIKDEFIGIWSGQGKATQVEDESRSGQENLPF